MIESGRSWPGQPGWHEPGPTCDGFDRHAHLQGAPPHPVIFVRPVEPLPLSDRDTLRQALSLSEQGRHGELRSLLRRHLGVYGKAAVMRDG